jgi:hypothetical protein
MMDLAAGESRQTHYHDSPKGMNSPVREARAQHVAVTEDTLVADLIDGRSISAPLVWYPRLLNGTAGERNNWRLIADGEGIHWPDLDEDLSVNSLIAGRPSGESPQSLKRWLERRRYRPDKIELLFIAEAPPANNSRRFSYFVPVEKGDALFLEMMKVLYPKKANFVECDGSRKPRFDAKQVRKHKAEFLEKFSRDGFYLIDAVDEPMPRNATTRSKVQQIRSSLSLLRAKLDELRKRCGGRDVRAILIGAPVYNVCAADLRKFEVCVLNEEMIDTPAQGGQKLFRRKLGKLLRSH